MARPASAPANAFIQQGITTIRWGTDGFLQDAALQNGAAIVRNIKISRKVDKDEEPNNSGYVISVTLMIQGQKYVITVTDDTAKSWPTTGQKALIQDQDGNVAEGLVVEDEATGERKKTGERSFTVENYTAFAVV